MNHLLIHFSLAVFLLLPGACHYPEKRVDQKSQKIKKLRHAIEDKAHSPNVLHRSRAIRHVDYQQALNIMILNNQDILQEKLLYEKNKTQLEVLIQQLAPTLSVSTRIQERLGNLSELSIQAGRWDLFVSSLLSRLNELPAKLYQAKLRQIQSDASLELTIRRKTIELHALYQTRKLLEHAHKLDQYLRLVDGQVMGTDSSQYGEQTLLNYEAQVSELESKLMSLVGVWHQQLTYDTEKFKSIIPLNAKKSQSIDIFSAIHEKDFFDSQIHDRQLALIRIGEDMGQVIRWMNLAPRTSFDISMPAVASSRGDAFDPSEAQFSAGANWSVNLSFSRVISLQDNKIQIRLNRIKMERDLERLSIARSQQRTLLLDLWDEYQNLLLQEVFLERLIQGSHGHLFNQSVQKILQIKTARLKIASALNTNFLEFADLDRTWFLLFESGVTKPRQVLLNTPAKVLLENVEKHLVKIS